MTNQLPIMARSSVAFLIGLFLAPIAADAQSEWQVSLRYSQFLVATDDMAATKLPNHAASVHLSRVLSEAGLRIDGEMFYTFSPQRQVSRYRYEPQLQFVGGTLAFGRPQTAAWSPLIFAGSGLIYVHPSQQWGDGALRPSMIGGVGMRLSEDWLNLRADIRLHMPVGARDPFGTIGQFTRNYRNQVWREFGIGISFPL